MLNDISFSGRSTLLPYDLSISLSFGFLVVFFFVFCILAPETGLGTDIDLVTGQLSRQSDILTLVADRQRELTVGNRRLARLGAVLSELDLHDIRGGQCRRDKLGGVVAVGDDIDLLTAQLVDDGVDTRAACTDAGADRVDLAVLGEDRHLGAGACLAGDRST